MPILNPPSTVAISFPVIRIPGVPDFNAEGQNVYAIENFDKWWSTPPPRANLAPKGGGAGAIPSGDWLFTEQYLTLSGWVVAAPENQEPMRQQLLMALPTNLDVPVGYVGNGWDVDKQIWVRRYDEPVFDKAKDRLRFSIPLVAADPLKYTLNPLRGSVGIYVGATFYETFTGSGFAEETYTGSGFAEETYLQTQPATPYPPSLSISSGGSYSSQRVTIDVAGPLSSGDWYLLQETAGLRKLWVPFTIAVGMTLTIDCYERRVYVNGVYDRTLTGRIRGDLFTLEPGANVYKLVTGSTDPTPWATITAYAAYQ